MSILLIKAIRADCPEIYDLQLAAFRSLLNKYQDFDYSPGAEKIERIYQRFDEPITDYWFISLDAQKIGAVRICKSGELCKIKQIFISPEYQNNGYAQEAIRSIEVLYPNAVRWELDTILQEEKLCYLYEKMGYRKTGKTTRIKDGMDIVFYAKSI